MGADPGQRLKPQPAQPVDLLGVHRRGRPGPRRLQLRPDLSVQRAGVEFHRVHQRHIDRGRRGTELQAAITDAPHVLGELTGTGTQAAQIVEPDPRVRPAQIHTRDSGSAADRRWPLGQGAQLFLGVLTTAPSAVCPVRTCSQEIFPRLNAIGYFVVNQPTVRDRSTSSPAISSSRP